MNYGINLGFTGLTRDAVEALVKEKIYPHLPDGTLVTIEGEEEVVAVDGLAPYIGEHLTIQRDNKRPIKGYLAEIFPHEGERRATLVFEDGSSYLASEFEVAIVNEGGEYDRSEDTGEVVEQDKLATVTPIRPEQPNPFSGPLFDKLVQLLNEKLDK